MKTFKHLAFLLLVAISACQTDDPAATCRLSKIDRGNGNVHVYTYDATGRVSTMTRDLDPSGKGNTIKFVYTFNYDAAGLLTKSSWTLDGAPDGSETYTYTNGKVSKVNFEYADGTKGTNNIKHNAAGLMSEFTIEFGDPSDMKQLFEYDANGVNIKSTFTTMTGEKLYEYINKPMGSVKDAEGLLLNHLPYDLLIGQPWQKAIGGIGSVGQGYAPDEKGNMVADGPANTIKSIIKNNSGYATQIIDNNDRKNVFTIDNCK